MSEALPHDGLYHMHEPVNLFFKYINFHYLLLVLIADE